MKKTKKKQEEKLNKEFMVKDRQKHRSLAGQMEQQIKKII